MDNKSNRNNSNNNSRSFLWGWGNLSAKIPAKHKQRTPLLAESLDTQRIASITCDSRHIIVVTRDGIIFLWELGKSLKKISKKLRYSNYKNRPESLNKLVNMMRNQLPIVSNFEINTIFNGQSNDNNNNDKIINNDISTSLNKRIFYGSDAVKWLVDHECVNDENESIRFCQALLNEGRMECANKYLHKMHNNDISLTFKNDKSGLYYFSDSRKKISANYMQKFHAVPADPTLKFSVVSSNQHYFYTITQNGKLYEWDLKQRSIYLKNKFIAKSQLNNQKLQKVNILNNNDNNEYTMTQTHDEEYDDEYDDDSTTESISDPLDSSVSQKQSKIIENTKNKNKNKGRKSSMSLNETNVESFPTDNNENDDDDNHNDDEDENSILELKYKLAKEQEIYIKHQKVMKNHEIDKKKKLQETVKEVASKWIDPKEFFVGNNNDNDNDKNEEKKQDKKQENKLPEMLLLEKLSCRPTLIHSLCTKYNMRYVSCGHDFVVVLNEIGQLYSWGNGYHGKLGHNSQQTIKTPKLIKYFSDNNIIITRIECGFNHSIAICNNGKLYSWGSNRNGKLGIANCKINFIQIPTQIKIFKHKYNQLYHNIYIPNILSKLNNINPLNQYNDVNNDNMINQFIEKYKNEQDTIFEDDNICFVEISCGYGHNLAVVAGSGQIYSWGANLCGQLGLNDQNDRYIPTLIQQLISTSSKNLNPVFNSINNDNNMKSSSSSSLPSNPYNAPPPPSNILESVIKMNNYDINENPIIRVGCGAFHSCALTINGDVFCWGDNSDGQLGIGNISSTDILTPQLVDYLSGIDTTNISCGADFTFAVSENFINYQSDYFHPSNNNTLKQRKLHYDKKYNNNNSKSESNDNDNNAFGQKAKNKMGNVFKGITNKLRKPRNKGSISSNIDHTQIQYRHPQYRQPGLPSKHPSDLRKQQKEIQKLQQIFRNKQQQKEQEKMDEKKFDSFTNNNDNDNNHNQKQTINQSRKTRKPTLNFYANIGRKSLFSSQTSSQNKDKDKLTEEEEKGYSESDINRAVENWCKIFINDFEKQRNSPKLRESVWKVGIPTRLRGKVWPLAIGNQLNINKRLYELFEKRAKQMEQYQNEKKNNKLKVKNQRSRSNSLDKDNNNNNNNNEITSTEQIRFEEDPIEMIGNESTIKYISVDLTRTFPSLSYFQDDGPLKDTLHSLLQTYCFFRPDRGYIQGMSYLAANLLLYMDSYNAFVCFCNLLNKPYFDSFLTLNDDIIKDRIEIFNNLFEYNESILYKKFQQEFISPKEYLLDWIISLFTKKLSISVASRIWDIILIFGEMEIYRCCVAILKCIQKELLSTNDDGTIRRKLKTLPSTLTESQLISNMKTIKVPKKLKQQLQKIINSSS